MRIHKGFPNAEILIGVVVVATLAAIATPNFVRALELRRQKVCYANLRIVKSAKASWVGDTRKRGVSDRDINTVLLDDDENLKLERFRAWPECPKGGRYTLGAIDEQPTCSIPGHHL